jgi:hypothetical protein
MTKLMKRAMTNVRAVSPRELFSCSAMNPRTTLLPCIGWRVIVRATFWATLEGYGSTGRRWREDGLTRVQYGEMTKGTSEYLTDRGATMESLGKPERTKDVTILVAKVSERTRNLNHAAERKSIRGCHFFVIGETGKIL